MDGPGADLMMIPWCHNHGNRSKMAGKQAESVIKNIIKEITIESSRKGQSVSETLAAFMVRLFPSAVARMHALAVV